jgi:hypothetical protein
MILSFACCRAKVRAPQTLKPQGAEVNPSASGIARFQGLRSPAILEGNLSSLKPELQHCMDDRRQQ